MSTWRDQLRRYRDTRDDGFTLIEVLAAMIVVALGATAVVPILILGSQSANFAKLNTQAKNLAQERIERLRDLQYHVDRQNGPFVDLLDVYYTNRSATPVTTTYGTETLSGIWVDSGTPLNGEPAVPFYRVTISGISGYPTFRQTVTTQFLQLNGTAVAASLFPNYNSQATATDAPPALLVGVTVLTTWTQGTQSKSYRSYTRIADSRGQVSSVTSQAKAQLLQVTSTSSGAAATALSADVGVASADGSLSTGSTASASAKAGVATDTTAFTVANGLATSPGGTTSVSSPVSSSYVGGTTCADAWATFGNSVVQNITASTTSGIPLAPSSVDIGVPPANQVVAGLKASGGSGNPCGLFAFKNRSTVYDPALGLILTMPLIDIPDASGNALVAQGSAWVNASLSTANPHTVTSGANSSTSERIRIFPGLAFVGDGHGIVNITLTASTIACSASRATNSPVVQSASASYTITVDYWQSTNGIGGGARVSNTYSWSSASSTPDPLAALVPSAIVVYQNGTVVKYLSDYVTGWSLTRALTEGTTNGVFSLDQVMALTTAPVRVLDPTSAIGVSVGQLSCAADDNR